MYGTILKEAPEGYVPYQQWPEYVLAADIPPLLAPRLVGKNPVGVYRRFWPIVVEDYMSDKEPVLADSDLEGISANRILIWQRVFSTEIPHGWRRFSIRSSLLEGFAHITDNDYRAPWSESARRYVRKWEREHLGKDFVVEAISLETFLAAYKESDINKYIRSLYADMVVRKQKGGAHVRFIAARHIPSNDIAAAMALVDSPAHKGSHYLCGFIQKKYEHIPAMVGLVDRWYEESLKQGITFLHFGRFWQKGDPSDWKGFSQFKAKFGLHYISYPPALWRFAKGRLF